MCQDALFESSTINIGSGVRPVDERKKKRDGRMDNALKRDRSVKFHTCAEKSPGNRLLPKFAHRLTKPTLLPVKNLVTIGLEVLYYRLPKNARFLSKRW